MLKLEKLRFKCIGRFLEEQIIEFDSLGKFVQLGGQNNNTGGSSGAGKSTVFMALDHLFGVSHRPSTVLKCRYSDEGIFVEGTFSHDGKTVIVTRGKKLSIVNDGVPTVGNSEKTEEELDKIIGMPRKLFRQIFHKRQGEGGFFLAMTPAEVNTFLMNGSNLGHFKAKIQIADDKIVELTKKSVDTVTKLAAARSALKATEDAIESMGPDPIKEVDQLTVVSLKEKSEKSASALAVILSQHKIEIDTLELIRPKIDLTPFERGHLIALEGRLTELKRSQEQLTSAERDRQTKAKMDKARAENSLVNDRRVLEQANVAGKRIIEITEQLRLIRAGKCFNCGNDWKDAQKEEKLKQEALQCHHTTKAGIVAAQCIPQTEAQIKALEEEVKSKDIEGLQALFLENQSVQARVDALREEESKHNATQSAKAREVQSVFVFQQKELAERQSREAEQARGQVTIDRMAFDVAIGKLRAYEEARSTRESTMTRLTAQKASYTHKVTELTNTSTQTHNELQMAEELKRGLKSYLSCSFDETLDTISKNATDLIRHIPNMANATIQLEGIKETQEGKIKEEVTAVIHMDGEENVDIRSLCGGERTALDLAIDLSVIDWLENKANKGIDIFILDEPFNGLDTVCIEMALEVLKNSNSNKRLIIVDHNPEVKEMVESRLTAVRDGSTSRIIQL